MRMYSDIEDLIVNFLIKNGLSEYYLNNLSSKESCIGCTRDGGDHDAECPINNDVEFPSDNWLTSGKTTQSYKKQIDDVKKYYLKGIIK
jgi:hypothetical protein